MRFKGFYGNERTKGILSGMFDARRIPNAILIDGPHGAGKRTLARIISAAAVCSSDGKLPCGECRQCINALSGVHPDVLLCGGKKSGPRSFGVDAVRSIRLDAYVKPNDAARKVYIIANMENMTEQAQNALLKILEEPPAFVVFVLTSDSRAHVLETVRSRSVLIAVGPVPEEEAARALMEQCAGISGEDALRAARISGGIIGRAKLMLDAGFSEITDFVTAFVKCLCRADIYEFLSLSGRLEKDGGLCASFLDILPALMCDAVSAKKGAAANISGFSDQALALSRAATVKRLLDAELSAVDARDAADRNANSTLALTALFSELWHNMHE